MSEYKWASVCLHITERISRAWWILHTIFLITQQINFCAVPIQCSIVLCSLKKEMREVFSLFIFSLLFLLLFFVVLSSSFCFFFFFSSFSFSTIRELRSNYHFPYCFVAIIATAASAASVDAFCVVLQLKTFYSSTIFIENFLRNDISLLQLILLPHSLSFFFQLDSKSLFMWCHTDIKFHYMVVMWTFYILVRPCVLRSVRR